VGKFEDEVEPPTYAFPELSSRIEFASSAAEPPRYVE
jgi:hypothetical protein